MSSENDQARPVSTNWVALQRRTREQLEAIGCAKWDDASGLMLITPELLKRAKPGTKLYTIFGEEKVVGRDCIDGDTRWGYLAVGVFVRGRQSSGRAALRAERREVLQKIERGQKPVGFGRLRKRASS